MITEPALALIYVSIVVGTANVVLLLGLIKDYWKTYHEVKSGFTIGLLYFSTILLLQNVLATLFIALPLVLPIETQGPELHGPRIPLFLINLVQLIALSILFKITRN
ncbi:MAG TPA: hypothetical protein VK444_07170 [Methanobacteriaceae archaeon]|nr:hypothetical protein [Methanobacteriaceae archaeon]